jgi:hypothetical protein
MVSPAGATLVLLKGPEFSDATALHAALEAGYLQIKQQVQAMMAAQAFAALAQHAQQQQGAAQPAQQQQAQPQPRPQEQQQQQQQQQAPGVPVEPPVEEMEGGSDDELPPLERAPSVPEVAPGPAAPASTAAAPAPRVATGSGSRALSQPAVQPPSAGPQPLNLHFKFVDGASLQLEFGDGATARDMFVAVDTRRSRAGSSDGSHVQPYVVVVPRTKRVIGPADQASALRDLGVETGMTLAVGPNMSGHRPGETYQPTPPAAQQPSTAVAAAAAAAAVVPVAGEPSAARQPLSLHIKLPDSSMLKLEFGQAATLGQVFAAVDAHRSAQSGTGARAAAAEPYQLVASHPRREFGPAEEGQTLQQLDIESRSMLAVEPSPSPKGHRPPLPTPAAAAVEVQAAPAEQPQETQVGVGARLVLGRRMCSMLC